MSAQNKNPRVQKIDLEADRALFGGEIEGLIAACYENERPLGGLAGLLDWRFHGLISHELRRGMISGKAGECAYFPITRNGRTFHIILVGAGQAATPGKRSPLNPSAWKTLRKNLVTLNIAKLGLSRSDLGDPSDDAILEKMEGVPIWIVP